MINGIGEALEVITQRRNYLTSRIAAKLENGWETQWDERERDALTVVIEHLTLTRATA